MTKAYKAYAEALKEIVAENNIANEDIIFQLNEVIKHFDDEFISFLKHPNIDKNNKKEIFKKAFSSINPNLLGLIYVLIDNNEILLLPEILEEFTNLINNDLGVVKVQVISTSKIDPKQRLAIINYITSTTSQKVVLEEIIDSKVVGGIIIKYNGKVIDASLLNKQLSMKEYLKK